MQVKSSDLSIGNTSKIELKEYRLTRILESWIDINASVSETWNVLVDFKSWENWNSFIPIVKGDIKVGNKISIRVISPGLKEMVFKPTVFELETNKRLVWGGGFLFFVYKGVHEFIIEYIDDCTTRFRQIEKFQGPIVLLMRRMIYKTALGYIKMNEELKQVVECNLEKRA
jgi:hypothetical protein